MFEKAWGELEAKYCFQRPSEKFYFAFYVFIKISNFWKKLFSC